MNNLTGLNLSGLSNLNYLNCSGNNISGFNFTQCTGLTGFYANNNSLSGNLNITQFQNLKDVNLSYNKLSGVILNGITGLETVKINDNLLSGINFNNSTGIKTLDMQNNLITGFENFNLLYNLVKLNMTGNSINPTFQINFITWLTGQYGQMVLTNPNFKLF